MGNCRALNSHLRVNHTEFIRAHKVRVLVYIAAAAVVGELPNVKSKVELKSKVLRTFLLLLHVFRE